MAPPVVEQEVVLFRRDLELHSMLQRRRLRGEVRAEPRSLDEVL
jgi:hypothetical protein